MAAPIVVGLFRSRGIAEDACNRLRTEGVPDSAIGLQTLCEVAPVTPNIESELAAFAVDPLVWGNVRDTYVSYIHNGETVVLVSAVTDDEIELATDVLRMFEPLAVDLFLLEVQTEPAFRSPAI